MVSIPGSSIPTMWGDLAGAEKHTGAPCHEYAVRPVEFTLDNSLGPVRGERARGFLGVVGGLSKNKNRQTEGFMLTEPVPNERLNNLPHGHAHYSACFRWHFTGQSDSKVRPADQRTC